MFWKLDRVRYIHLVRYAVMHPSKWGLKYLTNGLSCRRIWSYWDGVDYTVPYVDEQHQALHDKFAAKRDLHFKKIASLISKAPLKRLTIHPFHTHDLLPCCDNKSMKAIARIILQDALLIGEWFLIS